MSFLDRIKNGANKASERAQNVVEINKLNGQISNIEREMNIYYQRMGQVFYEGYRAKDMSQAEKEMMELAKTCDLLAEERDEVRTKIAALKNERLCECGKVVPQDAVFCPFCGRKLKSRSEQGSGPQTETAVQREPEAEDEQAYHEAGASSETVIYRGPLVKEVPDEYGESPSREEEKRHQLQLERERERQEELDRRIRTWKENMESKPSSYEKPAAYGDAAGKCQICAEPLVKGTKWCPNCGAEQL
ncbi:zinc ribbon domain-containing protein [Paenibacillus pinistramenti]|uniref:zinc ribbon domain-containing protein n=1 Tax=Paenibacillus pinistramenti TaxID=1768003 RepID=UPI00110A027A|nr:zinc ribbon domain-containing protein [Paenibacillus pinistramenti]